MLATLLGTQLMFHIDEKSNGKYEKRGPSPSLWRQQGPGLLSLQVLRGTPCEAPGSPLLPLGEEISGRLASQPLESRSLVWGGHLGCGCSLSPAGLTLS